MTNVLVFQKIPVTECLCWQGAQQIMDKLCSLSFQKIAHLITATDCQPMYDGGILINILGQLKVIEDIFFRSVF